MHKKFNKKKDGLYFMAIGGCSEIGMNLYAYIYNDQWILVDMGMGFDNSLGRELVVPSPQILLDNKSKIKALFITHSHEDHIGAIPYFASMIDYPIYGRPFAIEMIRHKLLQFDLENNISLIKAALKTPIKAGNFSVEFVPVAHSTPESVALAITTTAGTILHSGDWRLDDEPVLGTKTDEERLREYGNDGIMALVCDSTNVFNEFRYGSEKEVRKNLIDLAKKYKKNRLLITCFASNLARLESCHVAAKESGRQLVATGRSIKKIEKIAKLSGYLSDIPPFLDEKKANILDPAKTLLICTGSQGEENSALSKIVADTHRSVKLRSDDVVVFSSRVIPGNEKFVSDIQNQLVRKGVKVITNIDCDIHASGHPSKEELVHLYGLLKPHVLIPIHGETIQLHRHAEIGKECGIENTIIPQNGSLITLTPSEATIVDTVRIDTLGVDGTKLIPVNGLVYKHRKQLSSCGVASILIRYARGSIKLLSMECFGVFEDSEKVELQDIQSDISSEIRVSIDRSTGTSNAAQIKLIVAKIAKSIFIEARGKSPIILVHVTE
ncbi:MAG: ribonuclease J [Holosporaceae bacterium]|jgi:ribonuclease J|nr:ribonuclease J [Holosporaceae bacterium]